MSCTSCNKLFNKVDSILTGYYNTIIKDNVVEEIAKTRLDICNVCVNKNVLLVIGDKTIYKCSICQCPIEPKVRSNDTCPIKKW